MRALGIVSSDGAIGGIHQGNVAYAAAAGYAGIWAPSVVSVAGMPVVVHDVAASGYAIPVLGFGPAGRVNVKIAGGGLVQPSGDAVAVSGLTQVLMGAGMDSCGRGAAAQAIGTSLLADDGTDVTAQLVSGP